MSRIAFWLLIVMAALSGACSDARDDGDDDTSAGDADTDADADADTDTSTSTGSGVGCTKMDLLFVVDDSGSMDCEQGMLAEAFPGFIEALEDYNNANADAVSYRIGVTSTGRTLHYFLDLPAPLPDMPLNEPGLDGELVMPDGATDPWIDGPGNTDLIVSQFSDIAKLGTGGPTYEMPLECMREALQKTEAGGPNEGFLREDSLFVLIIITDEDDCSRTDNDFTIPDDHCMDNTPDLNIVPLQEFKDELDARFGGEGRYVVVTIAGGDPGCEGDAYPNYTCSDPDQSYAGAYTAVRLIDFTTNYVPQENAVFYDICTGDLPAALSAALEKMEVACNEFVPE